MHSTQRPTMPWLELDATDSLAPDPACRLGSLAKVPLFVPEIGGSCSPGQALQTKSAQLDSAVPCSRPSICVPGSGSGSGSQTRSRSQSQSLSLSLSLTPHLGGVLIFGMRLPKPAGRAGPDAAPGRSSLSCNVCAS